MVWILFLTQADTISLQKKRMAIAPTIEVRNNCRQFGPKIMNQIVQRDTSTDQKQIDSTLIVGCGFVWGSPRGTQIQ